MKIRQAWDQIRSQFQSLYTSDELLEVCTGVLSRVTGVACGRYVLGDRVKVTSLAVLANEGKAERSKSD